MTEMPRTDKREGHGHMWAMWICCAALLLFLLVNLLGR